MFLKLKQGKMHDGIMVVKMDVFQPDGRQSEAYSKRLSFRGETCTRLLPLALNDMKGKWRLRITEVISGVTAEKSFTVN